jgi:N6-adenosine-specific RNA methylase IME4
MNEQALVELGPLIRAVCTPDAYVFSWATRPNLDVAIRVLDGWGLKFITMPMTWVKLYRDGSLFKGPGRYTFSNAEDLLLGRYPKSKCWHPNTGWRPESVVQTVHPQCENKKIIHSRKPEEVQDALDRWLRPYAGDSTFLEIFATRPRDGWTCFGYDVTKRDIREDLKDMAAQIELEALAE